MPITVQGEFTSQKVWSSQLLCPFHFLFEPYSVCKPKAIPVDPRRKHIHGNFAGGVPFCNATHPHAIHQKSVPPQPHSPVNHVCLGRHALEPSL